MTKRMIVLLLVIPFLLAGCQKASTPTEEAAAPPAVEPTSAVSEPTSAPEPTEVPAAPLPKIVIALETDIDTMELDAFKSDAAYELDANTQERPIDYVWEGDSGGNWFSTNDFEGSLVESWEISDDGMSLTFNIRKGVTFNNGNPVDANAFKHSYERHISLAGGVTKPMMDMALGAVPEGATIDQIEVVDDYTVALSLTRPNPNMLSFLATISVPIIDPAVTAEYATEEDPWATEYWKTGTIGTGPYRLARFEPGVEWELEPYEGYWNPDAIKNGGILVKVIPSAETRLLLLKAGDIDVVWGLPLKDMDDLVADPDINVVNFASRSQNFMVLNNAIPPFDNVKVRQAISYAIPYKDLIEKTLYGYASPLQSPFPLSMPGATFDHWPYGDGRNYEKARELLAEAGYPDGFETELNVLVGKQADQDSAILIQDALAQIGIDVKLNVLGAGPYFDALYGRTAPMVITYIYSFVNDPYYYAYYVLDSEGAANFANYANERIDELISDGFFEPDIAKRNAMTDEMQKIFLEEAGYVNLFSADLVVAVRSDVKGFAAHADGQPRFWTMYKEE